MKIERLRKSYKKEIIIGVLVVLGIVATITMTTTKAKYRATQILPLVEGEITYTPYDFKIMAMYKSDDGVNYTEITDRMPSSGYVINESKSYCTIDNVNHDTEARLYTNENGEHVFANLKKIDKCYIWFDAKPKTIDDIIASSNASSSTPTFSNTATTDEGVFKTSDGMYNGTTYYWRGATTTNHVIFANKCWRIVRINGDKTMRLIYNGDVQGGNTCTGNGANSSAVIMGSNSTGENYSTSDGKYDNSSYVGWTYTLSTQRALSGTSSNAKTQTENWYKINITDKGYDGKVEAGKFCNDRNTASGYSWSSQPSSIFYYAGYDRRNGTPTTSCSSGDTYTLKVGAITMDEVVMAGSGRYNTPNENYYLYNNTSYWTMTPFGWAYGNTSELWANVFYVYENGRLTSGMDWNIPNLRPVINLRSDVTFKSGSNGTSSNPYIVQ